MKPTPKVRPPPEGKEDEFSKKELNELPMTSNDLIRLNQNITAWEKDEVQNYDKIFFYGPNARKIDAAKGQPYNNGFDDESGSYIKVLNDHLMYRYEVLEVIGKVSLIIDHNNITMRNCKKNTFGDPANEILTAVTNVVIIDFLIIIENLKPTIV